MTDSSLPHARAAQTPNLATPRPHVAWPASSRARDPEAGHAVAVLGAARTIIVSGSRDARVAAIAACQRNRVSRRQLLAAGLSTGQIHHLARTERLFAVLPGVYTVGSPAAVAFGRETAVLLAVRDGGLLSHRTGARLWEMGFHADDGPIHVTVDNGWLPQLPGVRGHRSRILASDDRRIRAGLPVCSPARVLLDLAAEIDESTLSRLLDEAQIRNLVTLGEVSSLLERAGGHPGAARLRELIVDGEAGVSESEAERLLYSLLAQTDLPPGRRQARVGTYRVDLHWPEARLAVEVDGFGVHSRRRRFESDRIRDARLDALGVHVHRVTWRQMTREPLAMVARIAGAYARRMQIPA